VPVEGEELAGRSLLSLRTVAFGDGHYKLALDVHTTSARRLVSAMSVFNGPRVTALLERIADDDAQVREGLRVAPEHDAAGLDSALTGSVAHHLGVIVRPASAFASDRGTLICCAALGSTRPGSSAPVLDELLAGYEGPRNERAAALLGDYAGYLLPPLLRLLSAWGISLEPHLQNTLVEVVGGRPVGFVVRDLGGIRIHQGRLADAGERIETHPESFIVTNDETELQGKLAHCVLHAHLATLVGWLEEHTALTSQRAWSIVADVVDGRLGAWQAEPRVAKHAVSDHAALFAPRVRTKALFTMRIGDRSSEYDYVSADNPLAQALAAKTT
jgi:siderophore synthetase component